MDAVTTTFEHKLQRLLVENIKYERIGGSGPAVKWGLMLFKNEELVNCLTAVKGPKSVYEYVVYDSDAERKSAEQLDQRDDNRLFIKLPGWFEIDTSIGKCNPDWAILKHDGKTLYLVRKTYRAPVTS